MIRIFLTFVMLGFFSFGGGYSFLPLMQSELVDRLHWLTRDQFILALTAGQISPGPVAVAGSFAGFLIGYERHHSFLAGLAYAFLAWLGTNTATIICMGLIMRWYDRIAGHPAIPYLLRFIMPVVIGMILYLALKMGLGNVPELLGINASLVRQNIPQIAIGIAAFALALSKKLDYSIIIIAGGVAGFFLK